MSCDFQQVEKIFINKKIEKSFSSTKKLKIKPKKILIMGLPGTGKTTLAKELIKFLPIIHLNADEIRKHFDDWDFSKKGRIRQADRMTRLSDYIIKKKFFSLADFVCPLEETRSILKPDIIIWMDTEKKGRFENTNKIFQKPKKFNFKITTKDAKFWSKFLKERIINNDY
tara:strand:- start:87 stop:596 length:510 start_codon:yes stop_codon:yes gene_type:complete